ncbi:MAG: adenylate/guanylate cyclase domain-containing protein [Alphaproteobacteria bacterium]|nr:adenylate/guanylate cyclase domain-containing protein [Alphaproteobacteria bacterium]
MELAVRARWLALLVLALMLPIVNPNWSVLYYEALLLAVAAIGWMQRRVARVGRSPLEIALIFADFLVLTIAVAVPNPLSGHDWPVAMVYREGGFKYFFLLLAFGTLAYSWRTVRGIGSVTALLWLLTLGIAWWLSSGDPALTEAAWTAFAAMPELAELLDPNSFQFHIRIQETVVFVVVAWILATSVRRSNRLLLEHAAVERERANLARYFSPNVVEELSRNDEPLKRIRSQDIAVLFVDIVDFTRFASGRDPEEVIAVLRQFHQRMEAEVFRHGGTLDKYLGDGLMATFGTPIAGPEDALNALRCARAMIESMADWNAGRIANGESAIRAGFGLHYGPAVLGDIGVNRLEFAVIGDTVNVASRIEALTRPLKVSLAASDELVSRVRRETAAAGDPAYDLVKHDDQSIRGLDRRFTVWTLA